ncbi:uncharacterized protein PV07_08584 [Cladophialophora immunda]|uniref:GAF domain-containing protein n=1 Tax=Cladophialophora immunda TaxID=569365 RepID=A0A0D2AKC3_9EURO|nr:uncharacterized protein PV07_08584 [Cladophialophora immunda]KIW25407.1 hypothetical protein PV07_08584 [Cladophialophora immunda]
MYHALPPAVAPQAAGVNWAGFYVRDPAAPATRLVLGPFMGKVACQTITLGKGVCGTAAAAAPAGDDGAPGKSLVVPDVEAFPGHIACDGDTKSEIVVPIRAGGKVSLTPYLIRVFVGIWQRELPVDYPRLGRWCHRHRLHPTQRLR